MRFLAFSSQRRVVDAWSGRSNEPSASPPVARGLCVDGLEVSLPVAHGMSRRSRRNCAARSTVRQKESRSAFGDSRVTRRG